MKVGGRNNTIETGKLRDYVAYQTYTSGSDGEGGYAPTWTTSKSIYAKIIPMKDTRVLEAAQVKFNQGFVFRVRYDTAIVEKNRFFFESNYYTIHSVVDIDSQHMFMDVICYT